METSWLAIERMAQFRCQSSDHILLLIFVDLNQSNDCDIRTTKEFWRGNMVCYIVSCYPISVHHNDDCLSGRLFIVTNMIMLKLTDK
jgi:hypothetical protein